ncbi:MAG: hypothetical protein NTV34_16145 [Proteobacteria bacterium]|nr:hypothetical protein [Pseudomonadota bacterium]
MTKIYIHPEYKAWFKKSGRFDLPIYDGADLAVAEFAKALPDDFKVASIGTDQPISTGLNVAVHGFGIQAGFDDPGYDSNDDGFARGKNFAVADVKETYFILQNAKGDASRGGSAERDSGSGVVLVANRLSIGGVITFGGSESRTC